MSKQDFAFIFRASRAVDPADLPARNAAARDWALARRADGSLQTASPLDEDGFVVTAQGVTSGAQEPAVASVLILQADGIEAAVALAKGHPGIAFGTQIEIRPVKVVAAPPRP